MSKRGLGWFAIIAVLGLLVVWITLPRIMLERWKSAVNDENPAVRCAAVRALAKAQRPDLLIDAIKDPNADVRILAADGLGMRILSDDGKGPKPAERAAALAGALGDDHIGVRREAAYSLTWLCPQSWPALEEAVRDNNPRVRAGALSAIAKLYGNKYYLSSMMPGWPIDKLEAIAPLIEKMKDDKDPEVRQNAALLLKEINGTRRN
jgi:HEAT repeat protein